MKRYKSIGKTTTEDEIAQREWIVDYIYIVGGPDIEAKLRQLDAMDAYEVAVAYTYLSRAWVNK